MTTTTPRNCPACGATMTGYQALFAQCKQCRDSKEPAAEAKNTPPAVEQAKAAKTQRRTTKISSSAQSRGYVAIQCDYIAAATTRIACVAKCDMEVKGVNGATVTIKAGEAFWLIRAGSLGADMFYVLREVSGEKKCSCPASKPCRHEVGMAKHIAEHGRSALHLRARQRQAEQSKAKAARAGDEQPGAAEQSSDLFERAAARASQPSDAIGVLLAVSAAESERRMAAPLNGNRGFSLMWA